MFTAWLSAHSTTLRTKASFRGQICMNRWSWSIHHAGFYGRGLLGVAYCGVHARGRLGHLIWQLDWSNDASATEVSQTALRDNRWVHGTVQTEILRRGALFSTPNPKPRTMTEITSDVQSNWTNWTARHLLGCMRYQLFSFSSSCSVSMVRSRLRPPAGLIVWRTWMPQR